MLPVMPLTLFYMQQQFLTGCSLHLNYSKVLLLKHIANEVVELGAGIFISLSPF